MRKRVRIQRLSGISRSGSRLSTKLGQRNPVRRRTARPAGWLVVGLTIAVLAVVQRPVQAQSQLQQLAEKVGVRVTAEGLSGEAQRSAAVQAIPYRALNSHGRQRVNDVLQNCAQHRSLPQLQYVVEPAMYRYLVEHPDVAVSTWRAMGISRFQMWQTGPFTYEVSAADGSYGTADVIYRDASRCLFICEGTYNSPLLPRSISASALILLQYSFVRATDGSTLVDQKMDAFIALPGNAAQALARLASPITNVIMDRNLFEVSLYARMMSKAVTTEPGWIEQLAGQLDGVLPQRRDELIAMARPGLAYSAGRPDQLAGSSDKAADPRASAEFRVFETSLSRMNAALPVVPVPVQIASTQNPGTQAAVIAGSDKVAAADADQPPGPTAAPVGLRAAAESAQQAQPAEGSQPPPRPLSGIPPRTPGNTSDASFQLQKSTAPPRAPIVETGPVR